MRTTVVFFLAFGFVVAGVAYYTHRVGGDPPSTFRTAKVERGELLSTISATGTLEPEEVVDVGAQVVGRIDHLGLDPTDPKKKKTIDYGSVVQENTVLAQIDDAVYKAQYDQAVASLLHAKADLGELEAHRVQAEQEWKRAQELLPAKAIAPTDYDLDKAAFDAAVANLEVGKATVKQNEAALELAKTNVDYCIIKSPVKGVIIDRRVNVGETVVSSLNAPSLFLIAKDLTRMQVWASVNEADIGRIHVGLPVTFTCDAFPHHTFKGAVSQIRYNATMTQNVVTYTVVVTTDNSKGTLLPYLTANVLFQIEDHRGVLKVPNAALRWKPRPTQIAADIRDSEQLASRDGSAGKVAGGPSGGGSKDMAMAKSASGGSRSKDMVTAKSAGDQQAAKPAKDRGDRGRLWVNDGGFVRPLDVQIVASDGTSTEVSGSGVEEGLDVVTGEITAAEQSSGETNPFAPKLFKGAAKSR